jgi:hypothetical protein
MDELGIGIRMMPIERIEDLENGRLRLHRDQR